MREISSEREIADILLRRTPLLDVRAPVEFARGGLPEAVNIPLLDDEQRAAVGKSYREGGREAAIDKGHSLIHGAVKAQRIADWRNFLTAHPDAVLYCFRGGLRSQITQEWLAEHGISVPRIGGGYRQVRGMLVERTERLAAALPFVIVAGRTGSGKTHLLNSLPHSVDLEGLANHRGSAFGQRVAGQPSQANFENQLGLALLRREAEAPRCVFLEDESRSIGSRCLPPSLCEAIGRAPMALIEASVEERSRTIMQDYILSNYIELQVQAEQQGEAPASAQERFSAGLRDALARIQKRLGGENYRRIDELMEQALHAHFQQNDSSGHLDWITALVNTYYDRMYDYQLSRKCNEVVFRGSRDEFLKWAGLVISGDLAISPLYDGGSQVSDIDNADSTRNVHSDRSIDDIRNARDKHGDRSTGSTLRDRGTHDDRSTGNNTTSTSNTRNTRSDRDSDSPNNPPLVST